MVRLPICVKCQIDMLPTKNHFVVEVMAGIHPYQKWATDKYTCPECGIEIIVGFANKPLAEGFEGHYYDIREDLKVWCSKRDKDTYDNNLLVL